MRRTTKEDLIKSAPDRFKRQYPSPHSFNKKTVDKLLKIRPTTGQGIAEIIGNNSWTLNVCDECNVDSDVTIVLGADLGEYDNGTAIVCVSCLNKAMKLIEKK